MRLFVLALPVALAACSLGGKAPPQLLSLAPVATVAAGEARATGAPLTVLVPSASAAISGPRVPVYQGANAVVYVKDAQWLDSPARLFQRLLSETVAARTGRLVLDARQTVIDPGQRVSGTLINFGIDEATSSAVVTYDAVLAEGTRATASRRFEARVPVTAIAALPAAQALDQAANQVAAQVADWVK